MEREALVKRVHQGKEIKLERGSPMKSIIENVNKHIFERIISLFNTLMLIFYDTCTFEW